MEVSVIKAAGVTVDNPNLPVFHGVDLSASFLPVKILFGENGSDSGINYVHLDTPSSGYTSGILSAELYADDGSLSRMTLSIVGTFFETYPRIFAGYYAPYDPEVAEGGDVVIKGLHPLRRYTVKVLSTRTNDNGDLDRNGVFTISGVSIVIDAANNENWYEFVSIYPDQNGTITMNVVPQASDGYVYLTGLEVVQA